jgi:hypothetical protein
MSEAGQMVVEPRSTRSSLMHRRTYAVLNVLSLESWHLCSSRAPVLRRTDGTCGPILPRRRTLPGDIATGFVALLTGPMQLSPIGLLAWTTRGLAASNAIHDAVTADRVRSRQARHRVSSTPRSPCTRRRHERHLRRGAPPARRSGCLARRRQGPGCVPPALIRGSGQHGRRGHFDY